MAVTMPTGPLYGAAEYLRALQSLMPRGRAWPRDPDTVLTSLLSGFAAPFASSNAAASTLLRGAFPGSADALLGEWEATLGLPRPYEVTPPTIDGRRAAVVSALTVAGSQSAAYFLALAAQIGRPISITTYRPTRVTDDVMRPLYDDAWAHTWSIVATGTSLPALDAAIADAAPAHTVYRLTYTA